MKADGSRLYSDRLGVIAIDQLQHACDLFGLGDVEAAEPASAGLWGQNILLSTTVGAFVLRGNPQPLFQLEKEQVVAAAINERSTLPVPWPYHVCADADVFGWPFAIVPRLAGTMGTTFWEAGSDGERIELARAHGVALAELHQARFDRPGPYDEQRAAFVEVDDHRTWTLGRIEGLRLRCREIDALTLDDEHFIDRTIEARADALTEPRPPVLVHHDFSLANTNYERSARQYRCTGVFDLGEAHIGDGEEDLVRFLFRASGSNAKRSSMATPQRTRSVPARATGSPCMHSPTFCSCGRSARASRTGSTTRRSSRPRDRSLNGQRRPLTEEPPSTSNDSSPERARPGHNARCPRTRGARWSRRHPRPPGSSVLEREGVTRTAARPDQLIDPPVTSSSPTCQAVGF